MKYKQSTRLWTLSLLTAVLILQPIKELSAQQDKVAAFKQSVAQNQKKLHQYQWTETTIISVKGDEKSRVLKRCFYGPDGKVQKQQISAPAPQESHRGLKGKIIEKKKAEITDYMQRAIALIHQYVPPDPDRIQAAQSSGKLSLTPVGSAVRLEFRDFVKPSDSLSFNLDGANLAIQKIEVKSYLDSPKDDPITLNTNFASLSDGVNYAANSVLSAPAKNIQVVIQNSGYQKMAAVNQVPTQQPQGTQSATTQGQAAPALSPQQIDSLTAPIALYPDALLAQMLTASTDFLQLQSFAGWMAKNAALTGSAIQDAAHDAGYDACFVALAPFPQVIQMMIQKPDWTKQLGQLFAANRDGVFDSIQRLRAQAQAAGNLKSTPQQEVQTQTTSSGQQVIVIQPANPQVVYVPQYNTQVVYTSSTSTTTAAIIGFSTGVIIGAYSSKHYYYGPYAWHGAAMYNDAWNTRYNYASDLQQNRYNNASNLQQNRQDYANQRQGTYEQNASQRQSTAQTNQSQRQSTSQANQAERQSSAATAQSECTSQSSCAAIKRTSKSDSTAV